MIKFFRNIRKSIIGKGATQKYFLYAIGEIILVVIGILIAVSINNWNEQRISSQKETAYLNGFKNDIEAQIVNFKGRTSFYEDVINSAESIVSSYIKHGKLLDIDSLNNKLTKLLYTTGYPLINTTYNEVNSVGGINLIQDKKLRTSIIEYYQGEESHNLSFESNRNDVYYTEIFPVLSSSIILLSENFNFKSKNVNEKKLKELLTPVYRNNIKNQEKEFKIINAITLRILVAKTNLGYILEGLENAESILSEIQKELKK